VIPVAGSSPAASSATAAAAAATKDGGSGGSSVLQLPRGEVLLLGGDLAYPNPSRETYEQRLFVPFQEAMPPPPHYHPGAAAAAAVKMCLLSLILAWQHVACCSSCAALAQPSTGSGLYSALFSIVVKLRPNKLLLLLLLLLLLPQGVWWCTSQISLQCTGFKKAAAMGST
jgi:hypothetical protein